MNTKDWNPGYYNQYNIFIPYDKSWYCNINKLIHSSEKQYLNCEHCNNKKIITKLNIKIMKNQEITPGDSVTYNFADGTKITQPITKQGLVNAKGGKKSPQEVESMLSTTMIDKGAISFSVNAESNEVEVATKEQYFTAKERYNAKKDHKDFQKENPAGFANSLKQFRAMVIDKFTNTKMRVRMNVTVLEA